MLMAARLGFTDAQIADVLRKGLPKLNENDNVFTAANSTEISAVTDVREIKIHIVGSLLIYVMCRAIFVVRREVWLSREV